MTDREDGASINVLLVGPQGHGGEDVYLNGLRSNPPAGVSYDSAGDFHEGADGASCDVVREIMLNRIVHPLTIHDMGFRALRMRAAYDLIHVHAHPVKLANLRGVPLVMSEGSSAAVYLQEYLGWDDAYLEKRFARARRLYGLLGIHDRLLALDGVSRAYVFSDWAREVNIRWGADPEKIVVIYPGFDVPAMPERHGHEVFRFLFVGRDFERKGGFEVLEAFESLVGDHPEARLTIAGSEPAERNPDRLIHSWVDADRRERGLARLAELEARELAVRIPWVSREVVVNELYPDADAFVMPTHAEGFGFTNVEAMSFGLPVVTSTVGPAREIVSDERTGLLVPPGDPDSLATAMRRLVADRDLSRRMGEAGRAAFLERFTVERFRQQLGAFYRAARES